MEGLEGTGLIGFWLAYIGAYILYQLPLFTIALKSEESGSWLAFVPIANIWLMCEMADKPIWWLLVILLVPFVGIFFIIMLWMAIAENANKSPALGILMVFPIINLFVGYYMAFYEPQKMQV